ncbi:outer membrane protein insertion porin family [Sporomusaceae bacterium BoRhaA]|uniref:BamA/OMP85 family outer membrane protein n=1 Tax=Pelorhabdus rhamnosifermentans TaxID=2772457 RepID=UPI001C05FC74|nr:BamA/TamA family outer membrane protein [Pelorhabdus rhamnosifermentans]MBU2698969.1 outer membrane protein insertion porin family [Pelorhabdus rhamnosifermentans]
MNKRRYGQLVVAAFFCLVFVINAIAPALAADFTGKTVTSVTVTGNTTVAESTILSAIKVKPGDVLASAAIKQDMQSIYDLGYFFDVVVNFTEVPEGVKVVYTVMENPPLSDVVVKGNTKVTTEKIKSLIQAKTNTIINTKSLNDNMRAIEQYYHDQGYILAKVSDLSVSPAGVLTVTVNEGMLENIVIKGNEKTKDYVITREMTIKPGEPFNAKLARRSMQKVYNLGYFEDVNMKLNPGKDPNAVSLEADVVEQKTGTFSIGGGYSQSDGLVGIIELGDNNLGGTGDKAKIHWEFGGNASSKNYEFDYTHPWLDDKQTSIGFSIYNMTNQYTDYGLSTNGSYDDRATRSTYDKNRKGFEVTLGRPQGEYLQNYITFKNRKDSWVSQVSGPIDYSNPTATDATYGNYDSYLKDNFGLTRSVTLTRVFDDRDNVFNPTEGSRFQLSGEFAGKGLGGDFNFNKYTAEARHYFKINDDHVIALRVAGGYATGDISETNQFSVGGSDTLRGYDDDQFKGTKMLTSSAEYRFPIVKKVQGVVFADAGNAWNGEGYKLNDLKTSVGVGIRVSTPLGPIRIDLAKGEEGNKTHFSFGGQF